MLSKVIAEVTPRHQVNHQVQVFLIFESVLHVDQERVVQLYQKLLLIEDRVHRSLHDDACFRHFLHGVELALFAMFYLPHFAEAAPSYHITEVEMVLCHGYKKQSNRLS